MFVGHYSASFAGKVVEPRIPLWVLFLAVQFVDVLWAIFVLVGIEKVRIVPGITASSPLDLYYMPYTHSLVGALGWSALAFLVWQFFPTLGGRRGGLVLALAVFSHWVLDLIVHRPDLALYDNAHKMGFGLWNYRWPAFILEIGVLVAGGALYAKAAPRKGRIVGYVCVLIVIQAISVFVFRPANSDRAVAASALFFYFLFALVAWWTDREKLVTE